MKKSMLLMSAVLLVLLVVTQKSFAQPGQDVINTQTNTLLSQDYVEEETTIEQNTMDDTNSDELPVDDANAGDSDMEDTNSDELPVDDAIPEDTTIQEDDSDVGGEGVIIDDEGQ